MACIFFRMNVDRRRANGAVAQVLLNVVNRGAVLGLVRGSCMPQPMRRGSPYPRGFGTVLLLQRIGHASEGVLDDLVDRGRDRKSTRLNSSQSCASRRPLS